MNKFKVTNFQEGTLFFRATYSVSWFKLDINYNNSLFTVHITESECKTNNKSYIDRVDKTIYDVKKDGKSIITHYLKSLPKCDINRQKIEQFKDEIIDFCIDYIEQKKINDQKEEQRRDRDLFESIIRLL